MAFSRIAEKAGLKNIGRFEAIPPVAIQVSLATSEGPKRFILFRKGLVPRIVKKLFAANLAFHNMFFLVANAHLACEHILLWCLFEQRFGIDLRTFIKRSYSIIDGGNCRLVCTIFTQSGWVAPPKADLKVRMCARTWLELTSFDVFRSTQPPRKLL